MPSPAEPATAVVRSGGTASASRLVVALGLGALAVLTLAHPSATRMHGWPLAAVATLLGLLPVAALLPALRSPAGWRWPSPLLQFGVAALALGTVASAWLSPFTAASLPRIWPALGGAALFFWLHHAWSGDASSQRRAARWLAGAGAGLALVSLLLWSRGAWPPPWLDRNTIPFGHSTYTGGAMVLFLPWIALQAWTTRGAERLGWLAAVGGAGLVLVSTSSRGAVLALTGVGFAAAVAVLAGAAWSGGKKLLLTAAVLAGGAVIVLSNPRLRELVTQRQWGESARESNAQRLAMLEAGWKLGRDRPLAGWGPGSVPLAYPHVRARLEGGTENVLQLHNSAAQVWATTGLVGAVAVLVLVAGTATAFRRSPRTPLPLAAGASLAGCGLVALTDHQLDVPLFSAGCAASLALLSASVPPAPRAGDLALRGPRRALLPLLLALAGVSALPASWSDLSARRHYDRALTALGEGDGAGYLRALDAANRAAPHDPYFLHRSAAWLLEQRAAAADPGRQAALAREAATRLEASLATGAHEEFAHFNLGWLKLELGEPVAAIRHFRRAAELVPDKGGVYFGLGLAHDLAGQRPAAIRSFALELVNDPVRATSPAWEVPALAALQPDVRAEATRIFDDLRAQYPPAAVVGKWFRWWCGEAVPADTLRPAFTATATRFAAALPALAAGQPLPDGPADSWARAYAAWREPDPSATGFLTLAGGDPGFAAALGRRARRLRADFRAFLSAPAGDEAALVRTYRRQRPGYGVLALHPEGPPLVDQHVVQENRVATDLAAGLFPPKGWLPGRFLLALRPDDPR